MSGAEAGVGASIVKVGVAVIQRAAPSGIALLKSWLKGKEVLIVGQARAGKTTFVEYLRYGLFEDEKEKEKTKREEKTARFNVKMGRDSSLELSVKRVRDVPGQWGPMAHADLVVDHRPHALLIFIDLTRPLRGESERASAAWLVEFCRHLESRWRIKGRKANRIKSIILVMNKLDKSDARKMESRKKEFRKILDAELREARGRMMDEIAILPCVVVTNPEGTKAVDSVITHLAKALAK
jgi:GTPase SAR1 family protein